MKPELCETCRTDGRRAMCPTFPIPCEDLIDIYEDGLEAGHERVAELELELRGAEQFVKDLRKRAQLAESRVQLVDSLFASTIRILIQDPTAIDAIQQGFKAARNLDFWFDDY